VNIKNHLVIIMVLMLSSITFATEWEIDKSHSTIGFSAKHMLVSTVRGSFTEFDAVLNFDPEHPNKIEASVTIQVASINTKNEKRDSHLRSDGFFLAEEFPEIKFKAKGIKPLGNHRYEITSDLTMRGVTKEVKLIAEGFSVFHKNPWGNVVAFASLKATVNKDDFGLSWNKPLDAGGFLVSKEIEIEIELEMSKKN